MASLSTPVEVLPTVETDGGYRSVVRPSPPPDVRKLAKVPFVELADKRVQGVVSSGSDIARVYVSSIRADDHAFSCSTNNNRPCSGAGATMCKHIESLLSEAVAQYGFDRVTRYLKLDVDDPTTNLRVALTDAHLERSPSSLVFSRFLSYLTYLEHPVATAPAPELHWFPAGGR